MITMPWPQAVCQQSLFSLFQCMHSHAHQKCRSCQSVHVSHRLSYSMYSANAHIDSTHPRRQRRRPTSMYWRSGTKALTTRATRRTSTRACRPKSMGRGGVHVPPSARAVPRNAHYQSPHAKCSHSLAIERQHVDEKLSNACLLAYCRASLLRRLD